MTQVQKPVRIPLLIEEQDLEALQLAGVIVLSIQRGAYVLTEHYRQELREAADLRLANVGLDRAELHNPTLDQNQRAGSMRKPGGV